MPALLAYGSLLADLPGAAPARLHDHALTWGVAMDNARSIPGYKAYEDAGGARPAVAVCFLDVEAAPGAAVDGVLLEVEDADWPGLDARERNYARARVAVQCRGRAEEAWTYVGLAAARVRAAAALRAGTAVVQRDYLERVTAARAAHGLGVPGLPAGVVPADLRRRALPPG